MSIKAVIEKQENEVLATRYQELKERAAACELVFADCQGEVTEDFLVAVESAVIQHEARQALGIDIGFMIEGPEQVEWVLKKKVDLTAELETVKLQFKKEITRLESDMTHLDNLFKDNLRMFLERSGKNTLNLKYGTLQFKNTAGGFVIEDETELQDWLERLPGEIKASFGVKPKVWDRDLITIKKYCQLRKDEGGEPVPGMTYKEASQEFYVTIPKRDKQ